MRKSEQRDQTNEAQYTRKKLNTAGVKRKVILM